MLMDRRDSAQRAYPPSLMPAEGELAMISMLVQDNRRVDAVADVLRAEDFSDALLGRIYARTCDLVAAGQQANPVTLHPFFTDDEAYQECGGMKLLASLCSGSSSAYMLVKPAEQAEVIVDKAARRRLIDITSDIAISAGDPQTGLPELVDRTDAALVASVERREQATTDPLSGSIARAIARIEEIQANEGRVGAITGIDELDKLLGGFEPGQLIILAGRPGMGKTAVASSAALGLARNGHGVLFASLEMRSSELGMRMVSDLCCREPGKWIPFQSIVNGSVNPGEMETLRAAEAGVRSWPLQVADFGSATVARLSLATRRAKRQMAAKGKALNVVVVDYLQLLHPDDHRASAYEAVSQISKGLKALAKELDVTVIALAQLSRAVEQREDKRPQLSDLRDSGQIEQDADAVLFLYREEYYLSRQKPKPGMEGAHDDAVGRAAGKITFICAKRRNGPIGTADAQYLTVYQAVRSARWGRL